MTDANPDANPAALDFSPVPLYLQRIMILQTIADNYLWFLVLILLINMFQKKHAQRSQKKRTATLVIAILAMVLQVLIVVILSRDLPQWLFFPALAATLALVYPLRKKILVFRRTCPTCGAKLSPTAIINYDDNQCDDCWSKDHPQPAQAVEELPVVCEPKEARTVGEIDWDSWEPTETAVVCYLVDQDRVLLINKKRGLGAGLVNAPGGHVEPDETAAEAAVRETREETGINVGAVEHRGVLEFQFVDGLAMRGHVFFCSTYEGNLTETDEATPFWCPLESIPYDSMWEDDRLWLPLALEGKHIVGRFIFDGQSMLDHAIEVLDNEDPTDD